MTFSKRNLNSHYQSGVGLWVWVLRIVGARADGVLGRLLLAVRWDPRPLPRARFVTVLQTARIEVSAAPKAAANAALVTYTPCTRANASRDQG